MESRERQRYLRASTLPELLVAMVLAGLVLFFAYEGLGLLQKRLGISRQESGDWQLLRSHALIENLVWKADSIRASETELLFYSSGIPSDTVYISGEAIKYRKNGSDETLFKKAVMKAETYSAEGVGLMKSLDILLPDSGNDTLLLHYGTKASTYIETLYRIDSQQDELQTK